MKIEMNANIKQKRFKSSYSVLGCDMRNLMKTGRPIDRTPKPDFENPTFIFTWETWDTNLYMHIYVM